VPEATTSKPTDIFREFLQRYGPPAGEEGPLRLVREQLHAEPDEWQEAALRDYGRGERHISIRSCHGPGKTALLAWMIVHQLCCRFPQKTACTAPTSGQLYDALFAETKSWLRRLPGPLVELFNIKGDRIELIAAPEDSFATFRTARPENPEALQGIHSAWVLLIVDEASGVPEPIFEAAIGSMSDKAATTVLASNPVRTSGYLHSSQTRTKHRWRTYHVCAAPAVSEEERKPETWYSTRVSQEFCEEVAEEYGADSNAYRIRVLGEFPKADQDVIIPFEIIEEARTRDVKPNPNAAVIWGVDVARYGDDLSALAKRKQNVLMEPIQVWGELDTMQTTGRIKAEWDATIPPERPREILVDVIGMGAGVVDRLRELGLPARGINVSEAPPLGKDKYRNQRTELWFTMRDWFMRRDVYIGQEDKLEAELAAQRYKIQSSGKIIATPKEEMKKELRRSPDRADALMMTFAADHATMTHGGLAQSWNKPLKRNIKGVV
jgi:hypothetical protein